MGNRIGDDRVSVGSTLFRRNQENQSFTYRVPRILFLSYRLPISTRQTLQFFTVLKSPLALADADGFNCPFAGHTPLRVRSNRLQTNCNMFRTYPLPSTVDDLAYIPYIVHNFLASLIAYPSVGVTRSSIERTNIRWIRVVY